MTIPSPPIPALTARQMAEIDRLMVEELGLDVLQIMEVAGRAVALFARAHFLSGDPRGRRVIVLAGSGGNGGDGMVAARYLHGWGAIPEVWLSHDLATLRGPAAHQLQALNALRLPVRPPQPAPRLPPADLLIDALLGFSLRNALTGPTADLIRAANDHAAPILAVDLPSGLDATSGTIFDPCVHAAATLTLALPKTGLLVPDAQRVTGELHLADIGIPAAAYARLGLDLTPIFATDEFIRLDNPT